MILLLWILAATATMVGLGLWSLSGVGPRRRAGLAVAVGVIAVLLATLAARWLVPVWLVIAGWVAWRARFETAGHDSGVRAVFRLAAGVLVVVLVASFYLVIERVAWPIHAGLGIQAWLVLAVATFGWGLLVSITSSGDEDLAPIIVIMLGGAAIAAAALVRYGVLSGAVGLAPPLLALVLAGVLLIAGGGLVAEEESIYEQDLAAEEDS